MIKKKTNRAFFSPCKCFSSNANLAAGESGRCCCHSAFGFPGRDAPGPETKPRWTTANLSPLPNFFPASYQSSLLFMLQGSHALCLSRGGIYSEQVFCLACSIKKKKVCHWHSKLDFIENLLCPVFLENFKSGKASQLGNICRAEKRLP